MRLIIVNVCSSLMSLYGKHDLQRGFKLKTSPASLSQALDCLSLLLSKAAVPLAATKYWLLFAPGVLQCVVVCCSLLQCVEVCCSWLQCVAVGCSVLQCVSVCCSWLKCVAVGCCVLQNVVRCCKMLWGVSRCYKMLLRVIAYTVCCGMSQGVVNVLLFY